MDHLMRVLHRVLQDDMLPKIRKEIAESTSHRKRSETFDAVVETAFEDIPGVDLTGAPSSLSKLRRIFDWALGKGRLPGWNAWPTLVDRLGVIARALTTSVNTLHDTLGRMRRQLRDSGFLSAEDWKYAKRYLALTHVEFNDRMKAYWADVTNANEHRGLTQEIPVAAVRHAIRSLYTSKNSAPAKAAAALLAVAARPIEVLSRSTFSVGKGADRGCVVVTGIAKRAAEDTDTVVVRRPVELKPFEVVAAVRDARKLFARHVARSQSAIYRSISEALADALILALTEELPEINPHKLKALRETLTAKACRKLGANAAFELYGRPKNMPYESYLGKYLGHFNANSTKAYLAVNITPTIPAS